MRKVIVCVGLLLCALVAFATEARAQGIPPTPNRPGSTLLLPYFEVDLENPSGLTTLFSINNASATAILTHVTLWSDMGVPVFAFNMYLTGYDMQTINLRDILTGKAPRTASAGQDPGDQISPKGILSQDINFASCTGQIPSNSTIPALYTTYMQAALTGKPSTFHGGRCVARNLSTPNLARGYVTVDTVNNCTLRLPGEPGYFLPGGSGDVTNQNVLWGDYQYIDVTQDLAYGDALVTIQSAPGVGVGYSNPTDPQTTTPGEYTFYGRLVNWTAADNRFPLSTRFMTRYVGPKDFKTPEKARRRPFLPPATELVVWRDPKVTPNSFNCASTPAWYPLSQEQIIAFDEQEHLEVPTFATPPFAAATQRVTLATSAFPVTAGSGFVYLNLNTIVPSSPNPPEDPAAAQAWVSVLQRVQQGPNGGRFDVGYRAIRLDSATDTAASHSLVPTP